MKSTPSTIEELLGRARALAGLRIGHLAERLGRSVPTNLLHHKGYIGRLLEEALGVDETNHKGADFAELGVELKTIPVDEEGRPRESTFVGTVELASPDEISWESSNARAKLAHVLFVPILSTAKLPVAHRLIGTALLWKPTPFEEALLRSDWEAHMDLIRQGYVETISAHQGKALQIRPKGANADSLTWGIGPDQEAMLTLPRAFYLRASFTGELLRRHFALPVAK